jgi:hypothetical protein
MDPQRLAAVLAGLSFPARTWQLLAQADYYGVDHQTRCALSDVPLGTYDSLDVVLAMLNGAHRIAHRAR